MYIKLTFKVSSDKIGAEAGVATAQLFVHPTIVDNVNNVPDIADALERGAYVAERNAGMFGGDGFSLKTFYLYCGDESKTVVNKALELFHQHYDIGVKGLPGVLLGGDSPQQNEIIKNMTIALDNAPHVLQLKSFESEYASRALDDQLESGMCMIL